MSSGKYNIKLESDSIVSLHLFKELCTAKSMSHSGKHSKIDESIRNGFDWLIKTVYENYDGLHKRVEFDVKKRNETEQKAKRERAERVRKEREE